MGVGFVLEIGLLDLCRTQEDMVPQTLKTLKSNLARNRTRKKNLASLALGAPGGLVHVGSIF